MFLLKWFCVPIHREGWLFIGLFAAVAVVLSMFSSLLGLLGGVITLWCVYFFRDPDRYTPVRDGLVISPADGVILTVGPAAPPAELGMSDAPQTRISVFMSIFDVHINRAPVDGTVVKTAYRPGRFISAQTDKSSDDNERHSTLIATADGLNIAVVQIAGLVARRICCWISEGSTLRTGERFGIIRFGSRVDVYLPQGITPLVAPGQRSIAGETVFADLRAQEAPREAEIR